MRILFLSHSPNNPDGGASRVYHLLGEALRGRGHTVDLRHLEDFHPPRQPQARLFVQRTAMPRWIDRSVHGQDLSGWDVIMSSNGMASALFRRLRREGERPLLVNHVHGFSAFDHAANLSEAELGLTKVSQLARWVSGPFQSRWDAEGVAAADLTIVQNLRDLGYARAVLHGRRTTLIPAAVHPALWEASAVERSPSSRPAGALLWFASWEARKGAAHVPAAFRAIRSEAPEATLTLGGTGLAAEALLTEFDPRDRDHIRVLPPISIERQAEVFRESSIFLFPSLSEGFGLALVEAMCFGLAAVTTNTGFGGDYLTDGVNAAVIPPSSEHLARAVHTLLQDPARHARLAAAGREAARSFTLARMAAAYERAFTELRPSAAEEIEAPAYA